MVGRRAGSNGWCLTARHTWTPWWISQGAYDLHVPVYDGLYGRAYQQERDLELQQFLASAIGAHPELTVRLIHGTADTAIPMESSAESEAALADAGTCS